MSLARILFMPVMNMNEHSQDIFSSTFANELDACQTMETFQMRPRLARCWSKIFRHCTCSYLTPTEPLQLVFRLKATEKWRSPSAHSVCVLVGGGSGGVAHQ